MANAKKCDICGRFFEVPEYDPRCMGSADYERFHNHIRIHKAEDPEKYNDPELIWLHFDTCDQCHSDLLDYILSRAAKSADNEETEGKNLYLD